MTHTDDKHTEPTAGAESLRGFVLGRFDAQLDRLFTITPCPKHRLTALRDLIASFRPTDFDALGENDADVVVGWIVHYLTGDYEIGEDGPEYYIHELVGHQYDVDFLGHLTPEQRAAVEALSFDSRGGRA